MIRVAEVLRRNAAALPLNVSAQLNRSPLAMTRQIGSVPGRGADEFVVDHGRFRIHITVSLGGPGTHKTPQAITTEFGSVSLP